VNCHSFGAGSASASRRQKSVALEGRGGIALEGMPRGLDTDGGATADTLEVPLSDVWRRRRVGEGVAVAFPNQAIKYVRAQMEPCPKRGLELRSAVVMGAKLLWKVSFDVRCL